ncbi:hypothetical protein WISP_09189 [Willisornis vidua]|uniref:Thiamine pyrophosphate enzyme TPP-binding domain-containing protein n=1 Tax=Willisornis vidua TaxID=1566151 RepID=A0ABQ9DX98_9PASS|nr:hypothetical protein WISP_09189 [Willisornis vidua]
MSPHRGQAGDAQPGNTDPHRGHLQPHRDLQGPPSKKMNPNMECQPKAMVIGSYFRYNLPMLIIIVNNNGIYSGLDANAWKEMLKFGNPATWEASSKELVLFNILISDLDRALEGTLSKSADEPELGGAVESLKGREALERDLDRPEGWESPTTESSTRASAGFCPWDGATLDFLSWKPDTQVIPEQALSDPENKCEADEQLQKDIPVL